MVAQHALLDKPSRSPPLLRLAGPVGKVEVLQCF